MAKDLKTEVESGPGPVVLQEAETTEVSPVNEIKRPADEGGFCVYLGPTIRGVIESKTIYGKGRKAALEGMKDALKEYPLIAGLVVSGADLPWQLPKVNTPGNLLYENYRRLAAEVQKKEIK